jgi:hypothetical protein
MTVAEGSRFGLKCPVFHNKQRIIPRVPEPEVPTPESPLSISISNRHRNLAI